MAVLNHINTVLNSVVSSFEAVQSAASSAVNTGAWNEARERIAQMGDAVNRYREEMERLQGSSDPPPPQDPSWKHVSSQEVFTGKGPERFTNEMQAANRMAERMAEAQQRIWDQASQSHLVSPEMMGDMDIAVSRVNALQQQIERLNDIPMDLRTDQVNSDMENLRGQMDQIHRVQAEINDAMGNMDISAANEGFQRLNDLLGNAGRSTRDMVPPVPPDPPQPTWKSVTSQQVFTGDGNSRFKQELQAANEMAAKMTEMQQKIRNQASQSSFVSPEMMSDIDSANTRVTALQQRMEQMSRIPKRMRTTQMNNDMENLRGQMEEVNRVQEEINSAMSNMDISAANAGFQQLNDLLGNTERSIRSISPAKFDMSKMFGSITKVGSGMLSNVTKYLSLDNAKKAFNLSDTYAQTNARLKTIVGTEEEVDNLQKQIYASAQRSRSSYQGMQDTVTGLALSTRGVFSSNQEMVGFSENLNKLYTIAGASESQQQSATQQLIQAMGTGVVKGEDLNSIFAVAPNIIGTLASQLGVSNDQIFEMAANGEITAGVMKNAMLSATEEINSQLQDVPMTWGQAMNSLQGTALMAFEPVMEKLGEFLSSESGQAMIAGLSNGLLVLAEVAGGVMDALVGGAQLVVDNWDYLSPFLIGAAAAIGAAMLIAAVMSFASWIAAAWPFVLIAVVLGALMMTMLKMGVTFEQIGQVVGTIFGFIYAVGYNMFADLWNVIAVFAEFVGGCFQDPVAAVKHLFFDLIDIVLGMLETIANALDAVFKTNLSSTIGGFRDSLSGLADKIIGKKPVEIERMLKIDTLDSMQKGSEVGGNIGKMIDDMSQNMSLDNLIDSAKNGFTGGAQDQLQSIENNTGNTAGNTAKMTDSMDAVDEELKYMRDAAEQEIINRFTLADLKVETTNNNTLRTQTDFDEMTRRMIESTGELLAMSAEGVYA